VAFQDFFIDQCPTKGNCSKHVTLSSPIKKTLKEIRISNGHTKTYLDICQSHNSSTPTYNHEEETINKIQHQLYLLNLSITRHLYYKLLFRFDIKNYIFSICMYMPQFSFRFYVDHNNNFI